MKRNQLLLLRFESKLIKSLSPNMLQVLHTFVLMRIFRMNCMNDSECEHYWTPNGAYFCIHCGVDIHNTKK